MNVYEELKISNSESEMLRGLLKNPDDDYPKLNSFFKQKIKEITKQSEDAVKSERDKLRAIVWGLSITGIGVDIVGFDYKVQFQNNALTQRFGDLTGQSCYEGYMGFNKPCDFCPMIKSIEKKEPESVELIALDGRNYELISAPVPNPDGTVDKAIEVVIDITKHKKTEESLLREKKFTESAINAQRDTFFIFEPSTRKVIRWNQAFKDISGYTDEEISDMIAPDSYYDENDLKRSAAAIKKIIEEGEALLEMDLITKAGRKIPFEYLASSINDDDGNLKYIISIGRDITERKKREDELRLQSEIITNLAEGVHLIRVDDGKIVYTNPTFEKMFGYNPGEMIGKDISIINAPNEKTPKETKQEIVRILLDTGEWHGEINNIKKDGTIFWCYANVSLFDHSEYGKVIVAVHTDITERKKVEERLRESEEKYRSLFDLSPVGIGIGTPDGKTIAINDRLRKMTGYLIEDESEIPIKDIYVNIDDRIELFNILRKKGEVKDFETTLIRKDGSLFDALMNVVFIDVNGERCSLAIIEDITERKQTEEALRESERSLNQAQTIAHIGNWKLNPITMEISGSNEFFHIFGLTKDEATLDTFVKVVHPDDREYDLYNIRRGMETGESWNIEHRLLLKDNTEKWVHAIGEAIRDEAGKIFLLIGTVQDITESKLVEQKLKESEEKWRALSENSPSHIMLLDGEHKIIFINRTVPDLSKEEVIGASIYAFMPQEFHQIARDSFNSVWKTGESTTYTTKYITKEGDIRFFDVWIGPIFQSGKIISLVSHSMDITENKEAERKLKESEAKLRGIMNSITDQICVIDRNLDILYINSVTEEIYGPSALGSKCYQVYHGIDKPCSDCQVKKTFEDGETHNKECIRSLGGESMHCWCVSNVFERDEEERPISVVEVSRDITERRKIEQELKDSEEKFRNIAEQSLMGIGIAQDNKFKYLNKTYADIFGYSVEEMINWGIEDGIAAIYPDDREFAIKQLTKKQRGEQDIIIHYHYRGIKKSGSIVWIDQYSKSINFMGKPANLISLVDITERKKAEEKVQYQARLVENVSEAIISTDLDFNIVSWNIGAEKIYGWKAEEAIGKNVMDIIHVEYPNDEQDAVIKEFFEIGFWAGEIIQPHKDSTFIDVFSSVSLIKNANGEPIGVVSNNIDITEKKVAERLIIEENKKLTELNKIKQDLIIRISHELKTPLTSIYGVSQVFMEMPKEKLNEVLLEYREISHRGCLRLKELIDNLLDASKLDSNKFLLKLQNESLITLIEECAKDMNYLVESRKHKLTMDLHTEIIISIDRLRLSQALINLISNAIKNTPIGGEILIKTKETTEFIDIMVKDNGVGLTKKEQEKLFQKFGKIERYGMDLGVDIEGAGLGLHISKEIVELHGGQILVESEGRHKGTAFTIRLFKNP